MSQHRVQSGETLSKIAAKYNVTVVQLVKINGIVDPNFITVGQILLTEPPTVSQQMKQTAQAGEKASNDLMSTDAEPAIAACPMDKSEPDFQSVFVDAGGLDNGFDGADREYDLIRTDANPLISTEASSISAQEPTLSEQGASLGLDVLPIVGAAKSAGQVITGTDLITGEEVHRGWESVGILLGIVPGGKLLIKGEKAADIAEASITTIRKGGDIADTAFGKAIQGASEKTKKQIQGQSIFKVTKNTKIGHFKLRKGDQYYLDGLHKDHIEVFDKKGKARAVLNLDGTLNAAKSSKAMSRSIGN